MGLVWWLKGRTVSALGPEHACVGQPAYDRVTRREWVNPYARPGGLCGIARGCAFRGAVAGGVACIGAVLEAIGRSGDLRYCGIQPFKTSPSVFVPTDAILRVADSSQSPLRCPRRETRVSRKRFGRAFPHRQDQDGRMATSAAPVEFNLKLCTVSVRSRPHQKKEERNGHQRPWGECIGEWVGAN